MTHRRLHSSDDQSDGRLIARSREGDTVAFTLLVERYQETVAATVTGMMGAGPEADDVGQETFVRFWKALRDFREEASVKTYLTRIAINLSLNELKRKARHRKRFTSWSDGDSVNEATLPGEVPVETGEMRSAIRHVIQSLDPEHRSVVVLRLMEEYSTRETADLLGIPEGTVLSRLARAKEKLKKLLIPYISK